MEIIAEHGLYVLYINGEYEGTYLTYAEAREDGKYITKEK